jgi:hypothetical protein
VKGAKRKKNLGKPRKEIKNLKERKISGLKRIEGGIRGKI